MILAGAITIIKLCESSIQISKIHGFINKLRTYYKYKCNFAKILYKFQKHVDSLINWIVSVNEIFAKVLCTFKKELYSLKNG